MNQQEKLASLSVWIVGGIVFVVLTLATVAIFSSQSSNANTLGGKPYVEGEQLREEGDITIAQRLDSCPTDVPCLGKEFIPAVITYGQTSVLSLTVVNTRTSFVRGIAFTDILTPGLVLASNPNSPQPCGTGSSFVDGIAGGSEFTVTLGLDPGSCEITVTVRPDAVGTYLNNADNITNTINLNKDTATPGATLTVDPAPLTVTADDKIMLRGTNPPPLTATYSTFVNNDTVADLDVPTVLATTANSYSPEGPYPIFASGTDDANYIITHISGTMTVYVNRFVEKKGMNVYPAGLRHCPANHRHGMYGHGMYKHGKAYGYGHGRHGGRGGRHGSMRRHGMR